MLLDLRRGNAQTPKNKDAFSMAAPIIGGATPLYNPLTPSTRRLCLKQSNGPLNCNGLSSGCDWSLTLHHKRLATVNISVKIYMNKKRNGKKEKTYFDCVKRILNHFSDHACYLSKVRENLTLIYVHGMNQVHLRNHKRYLSAHPKHHPSWRHALALRLPPSYHKGCQIDGVY